MERFAKRREALNEIVKGLMSGTIEFHDDGRAMGEMAVYWFEGCRLVVMPESRFFDWDHEFRIEHYDDRILERDYYGLVERYMSHIRLNDGRQFLVCNNNDLNEADKTSTIYLK